MRCRLLESAREAVPAKMFSEFRLPSEYPVRRCIVKERLLIAAETCQSIVVSSFGLGTLLSLSADTLTRA
eukprot:1143572-Prorocentrum_lima.AAC.1